MNLTTTIGQLNRRTRPKRPALLKQDVDDNVLEETPFCQFCTNKGIWSHLSTRQVLGGADWVFGFITDPQDVHDSERLSCAFCKLVFSVLPDTAFAEEHRHNYRAQEREIRYCDLRPIAIKVKNEFFTSFIIVYNFIEYVSHSRKVYQSYRASIGLESAARNAPNTPGITLIRFQDKLDPSLIRRWIDRCQRHHTACSDAPRRFNHEARKTMMIDVRRMCLVNAETSWTYAALSYVWGQVQTLQTMRANLETLMTPGGLARDDLWSQIPRVIQDCIELTRSMNLPYLWVDSLCILQDDDASKYGQIASMDAIYFQAQITIIPYNGKSADVDMPGVRSGTRAMTSSPMATTSNQGAQRSIVLTSSVGWASSTDDAVHESRAWTLQEKVLSIRCLFISRWGMWFQCLTSRYSDVEAGELPLQPAYNAGLTLLNLRTPASLSSDDWEGWDDSRVDEFLSFAMHIEWYSGRNLTFQSDRMYAFRGILNTFQDHCQQDFLWGHPEGPLLPISLLWIHGDVGRSRDARGSLDDAIRIFQDYLPDRDVKYPTWSWTGWSGKVSFSLILDMDEAGFYLELDQGSKINTQPAFAEEDARKRGIDQALSPELFYRSINRGYLELTGPTISVETMCCGGPTSLHLSTLDETTGVFVLAHNVYPFSQEGSLMLPEAEIKGSPCGMIFGIPFWYKLENHRFVLLKTVPGSISRLFQNHARFRSVFEHPDGSSVCIAMLIWASGGYAERKGIALLDQTFWESRNAVTEKFVLL